MLEESLHEKVWTEKLIFGGLHRPDQLGAITTFPSYLTAKSTEFFSFQTDGSLKVKNAPVLLAGEYDFLITNALERCVVNERGLVKHCIFLLSLLSTESGHIEDYCFSFDVSNDPKSDFVVFVSGFSTYLGAANWKIEDLDELHGTIKICSDLSMDDRIYDKIKMSNVDRSRS